MSISPRELFSRSVKIFQNNYSALMRYVLLHFIFFTSVGAVFMAGLYELIPVEQIPTLTEMQLFAALKKASPSLLSLFLFLFSFAIFFGTWIQIGFRRTIRRSVRSEVKISVQEEMDSSKSLIWRSIGTGFLLGLRVMVPLLAAGFIFWNIGQKSPFLLILTGILLTLSLFHLVYYGIVFGFATMKVMFEKRTIPQAFQQSKKIVQGQWWNIFIPLVFCGLSIVAPYYILSYLAHFDAIYGTIFRIFTFLYYICILLPLSLIPSVILFEHHNK